MLNDKNLDIEEVLSKGEIVITGFSGTSMYPMLRSGKDKVVVEKLTRKLKNNDVPLYKSGDGRFILHRIIKIKSEGYVIRGDNLYRKEFNVRDDDIIGVLTGFYRGNRFYKCDSLKYKIYILYIRLSYPIRYVLFKKIRPLLSKFKRKIFF